MNIYTKDLDNKNVNNIDIILSNIDINISCIILIFNTVPLRDTFASFS